MTTQAESDVEDLDELEPELEAETEGESPEPEEGSEDPDEEVVVSIGEESPPPDETADPARAPEWLRELRKSNREKDRRIRELEAKVNAPAQVNPTPVISVKPTFESCDYDSEVFEQKLVEWTEQETRRTQEAAEHARQVDASNKAWKTKLDTFNKAKAELKVPDFDDAEDKFVGTFAQVQQGVILSGCDKPHLVIYALGKNPKKAQELAAITDPVLFTFAVAKLEAQLKVSKRATPPLPEGRVRGSAPVTGAVDSHLERLRAEADRTNDRTKVAAYMREKSQKRV